MECRIGTVSEIARKETWGPVMEIVPFTSD